MARSKMRERERERESMPPGPAPLVLKGYKKNEGGRAKGGSKAREKTVREYLRECGERGEESWKGRGSWGGMKAVAGGG